MHKNKVKLDEKSNCQFISNRKPLIKNVFLEDFDHNNIFNKQISNFTLKSDSNGKNYTSQFCDNYSILIKSHPLKRNNSFSLDNEIENEIYKNTFKTDFDIKNRSRRSNHSEKSFSEDHLINAKYSNK